MCVYIYIYIYICVCVCVYMCVCVCVFWLVGWLEFMAYQPFRLYNAKSCFLFFFTSFSP